MLVLNVTRSVTLGWVLLMSLLGCSESPANPLSSAPSFKQRPSFAVTPIYDSTGIPTITFYSDSTELTTTGGITGYAGTDARTTRAYLEQYGWSDPNKQWAINLDFSTGDIPFGSSYEPPIDVAEADMTFGAAAPDVRDRNGAPLPISSSRPPLDIDGQSSTPVVLPSSASPSVVAPTGQRRLVTNALAEGTLSGGVAIALGVEASTARDSIGRARRAAAVERMVITRQGRARLLARLRARFQESAGPNGVRVFTRQSGASEVRLTFDPVIGGLSQTETLDEGRVRSRSVNRYVTVQGTTVLSEVATTIFDADGAPIGTVTERHTNITMH